MAQKSGFFNSLSQGGLYDRQYNANDYSDNLATVISNGVLRSANNDLQVTASGRVVSVAAGRAWINGRYYVNDSTFTFAEVTAPTAGSRYDRVMLRLNNQLGTFGTENERIIRLLYVQGTESNNPIPPDPTRTDAIYDLVLATIYAEAGASSLTITDTRGTSGLCDWLYSNNKGYLYMRYNWTQTLNAATSSVSFNIPQYESNKGFLEVYVNGILDNNSSYTINNNVITFSGTLTAGTIVTVKFYKSIESTGIDSVAGAVTTLQNQMSQVQGTAKFTYRVTGLNDNIALSEIAQALYNGSYTVGSLTAPAEAFLSNIGGNAYLASMPNGSQVEIEVVGSIYANVAFSGSGTEANRYKFFMLGSSTASNKKIVFNFAKSERIYVQCANNTYNTVLGGVDQYIKNMNMYATSNGGGCSISMMIGVSGSKFYFDDCTLTVVASNQAIIANTGNFTNCKCTTKGATLSRCFDVPTFGYVRVNGGTHYAYGGSNTSPTVFYITTGADNGLIMAYNINTPIASQTGYIQKALGIIYGGKAIINGVVNYSLEKTGGARLVVTNEAVLNKVD